MTRRLSVAARGAILLEVILSLALFVAASITLLGVVGQAINSLSRSRDELVAADHARNAMAQIEAGIARPEALAGPIEPWDEGEAEMLDESFVGVDPGDAPSGAAMQASPEWELEIETEPGEFDGLTLVTVRAVRIDETIGPDDDPVSFTLRQLVRLGAEAGGPAGGPAGGLSSGPRGGLSGGVGGGGIAIAAGGGAP